MRFKIVIWIFVSLLTLSSFAVRDANAESSSWKSTQFDLAISWNDPWIRTGQESVPGDYDMVQLSAPDVGLQQEVYGIASPESDPRIITALFLKRFRGNLKYTTVQEWENCQCSGGHPLVITYTSSAGIKMSEAIDGWSIDPDKSVYVGAFSRPVDFTGFQVRDINRKISFDIPFPQQEDIPAPPTTPTPPSNPLRMALQTTPFTSEELPHIPPGLTASSASDNPLGAQIIFSVGVSGYIGYWVEADANAAQARLNEIVEGLTKTAPVPSMSIHSGGGFVSYHLAGTVAYYSIENNVIVAGYARGQGNFNTLAYDLYESALVHLANVNKTMT